MQKRDVFDFGVILRSLPNNHKASNEKIFVHLTEKQPAGPENSPFFAEIIPVWVKSGIRTIRGQKEIPKNGDGQPSLGIHL